MTSLQDPLIPNLYVGIFPDKNSHSPKGPHTSLPNITVDPKEENDWPENEKAVNLNLEYKVEESSNEDGFVEPTHTEIIENKKEGLDQKKFDVSLKAFSDFTFKNIKVESSDRNIDKAFNNDITEISAIKNETSYVNEVTNKELNYSHESSFKSEIIIKQEEIHIKDEEDNEDRLNAKKYEEERDVDTFQESALGTISGDRRKKLNEGIGKAQKQLKLNQCPQCLYKTTNKDHFKRHSVKHKNPDEIEWYRCPECPYKTFRKNHVKRHAEIHRSNEERENLKKKKHQWLYCFKCSYKTQLRDFLQSHVLAHSDNGFKCTKCSYESRTKNQVTIHQIKHDSIDKWHSCSLCPYKSYNKYVLEAHCRRRHGIGRNNPKQIEIYKCTECPYESGCKFRVKQHQIVHDRSNWFQCTVCEYKTLYKGDFKKHQVRHQGENAEGWHRCLECPFKASSKHELRQHLVKHKSKDELQWLGCSQCSFKTAHKTSLWRHQLNHKEAQEIEWFFCYDCSYKTKYKSCLRRHIMSKHKKQNDTVSS